MVARVAGVASWHPPGQPFRGAKGNFWLCRNVTLERAVLWEPGKVVAVEMLSLKLPWFCFGAENEEVTKDSSFVPNEMLLNLFHGCLQHDLSDREIPMADADHVAFMEQVLQRDRDGHQPPFTLPVIRGKAQERCSRDADSWSVSGPCFQVFSSAGVPQVGFSAPFQKKPQKPLGLWSSRTPLHPIITLAAMAPGI